MLVKNLKYVCLVLLLMAATVVTAFAGVEQLVADFKPLSAYIVMEVDGEYIIDQDVSKGVRVGDIFAAVTEGQKIIHPVTGEVLGTLDKVRAQLRVSKVKSGYSYAVPLAGSGKLKQGEAILRFQGIPATFWDYTTGGETLYAELKAGLPALEWANYASVQAAKPASAQKTEGVDGLIFILTARGLEIKDASFQSIRFYSQADLEKAGIAIAGASSVIATPVAVPATGPGLSAPGIVVPQQPAVTSGTGIVHTAAVANQKGVWFGPDMPGEIVGVAALDLDADGQVELATAFPHKILIGSMTAGQYQGRGFIDIPERIRVLGIDVADLDHNGKSELYITAVNKDLSSGQEVVASMVAEEIGGQMQLIADDIPFMFGHVDLPSEGGIIAGQRISDGEKTYGGKVYRILRKGNDFKKGDVIDYDTGKLTVGGFVPFEQNGQLLLALFDVNENLEIRSLDGEQLWSSGDAMGGSQTFILRNDPNGHGDMIHNFIKARLDKLTDGAILVPLNEGDKRVFSHREFSSSKIVAMQWDGYAMKEVWHTEPQSGYMADFRVADVDNDGKDEIIMGILFSQGGGVLSDIRERSALVVYELQ